MSKSIREKGGDPFMLGRDTLAKKNGTVKIEKTSEGKSDPFMLGLEVKKKETASQDSDITSEENAIVSEAGAEDIPQSQSVLKSEPQETDKKRYARIEEADAKSLMDEYSAVNFKNSLSPFNVVGNTRRTMQFVQSREGKAGKIVSDIINDGKFNKEDIDYLVKVAPAAAKQIIGSIVPDSTPQNVLSEENVNKFIDEGNKFVEKSITEAKIATNKSTGEEVNKSLASLGINPMNLANDQYASHINGGVISQKNKELETLEKQYPVKQVAKTSGKQRYYRDERANSAEYDQKKADIEKKYGDIQNQIGVSKAFDFASKNPTLDPLSIGEQWLKYADPDSYKLWLKSGKKGAINRDMAEVGVRALYASGKPGTAELAKADEVSLDFKYPDKIIAETYHRLGAELYKDQNWFLNAAPNVEMLDKAAEQLPEKNREVYNRFIREKEKRNIGTDVPMSGLINKLGEGAASTAVETWKGLGTLIGVRSDKKIASDALNEGVDTDFQDVGAFTPAKQRLKDLNKKQREGKPLSGEEIAEKQDLETYTGVRSTAQEIIDGTGNLTGQVLFQALGTKGLGGAASAGVKGLGLLKSGAPLAGLATEEAIASRALNFGISKEAITDISAAAVAYASSYDAAKRQAFRLMPDDEDAGKRTLYATIVGGLNAGTERLFKDEKVLSAFNKEISPNIKTLVDNLSTGKITQEALAPALTKILKNSAAFGKEMGKANLKESTEELLTSVGESVATAILAPSKFNEQQAFDDAVSTFTTTFLHGGLVSAAAGLNGYRANHISIPTISKLGIDQKLTEDTKSFINAQVLNGNMTQQEADEKFRVLNTASKINTEVMPQVSEIAPDLPQKAKEKYAVQLLNEKILTAQVEDTKDPVLQSALEQKVKESEKIRKQILNKEIFVDDDYSVVSEAQINAVNPEDGLTPEETVIRYAKDGKLSVYNQMVNDNPEIATDILRDVAQQIYGITSTGEPLEGGSRRGALSMQFSTDILEAAEKRFPTPESTTETEDISNPKIQTNESKESGQKSGQKNSEEGSQESGRQEAVRQQPDVIQEGAVETSETETAPLPEDSITVGEMVDKKGVYKGQRGQFIQDGQAIVFKVDNSNREYELGNIDEIKSDSIGDYEIEQEKSVVLANDDGSLKVRDVDYINPNKDNPLKAIVRNEEGEVISVKLQTSDGKNRTFRGQVAQDIAYEMTLKQISNNNETAAIEEFINTDEQTRNEIINEQPAEATQEEPASDTGQIQPEKKEKPKRTRVAKKTQEPSKGEEDKKPPTKKELSDQLRNLLGNAPLALDTDPLSRVTFDDIGLTEGDTIETAIDKLIAYDGQFTEIFRAIKADPNLSKVKLQLVDKLPNNDSGLYHPQGHGEGKDGLLQIAAKGNTYYTSAHELLHFFTLDSKAAEDVKESDAYRAIEDLYNYLSSNKEKPVAVAGNVTMQNYGLTNVKEFMAELFINPTFRNYVSDVFAKNKDEILKQSKVLRDSKKGGSIVDIIADLFRELFTKIFSSKNSGIPYDEQKSVIDNAVRLATDLFFGGQDVTQGQQAGEEGARVITMAEQKAAALSLPGSELNPIIIQFVKTSLEQGASIEDIKGALMDNGFTEDQAQEFIDNNKPPKPPKESTEETQEPEEEKPSGIKKGLVSSQLISEVNLNKISDKDMMALGRKILDTGEVKPEALVRKILKENVGVLTPAEVVGMITYKADLDNSLRDAYKEFNDRQDAGEDTGTLGVEIADLEQKIHDFDVAAVITANQQSMAFRLRQYMLDRDYNVTTQIEKYKKNNNGYIPPEVEAKFRELDKELKAVKDKLAKAEKKLSDKQDQQAVDNIREDVEREKLFTEEQLEQKVKEGVQKEIDAIHSKLSPEKKSLANKAIKALENIQKKLRGKSYSDATGFIAFIDSGITVIKNAIKAGVAVADAVEMGIGRIKELMAKKGITTWAKEDEFRKDAIEGFESEGVSTSRKPKDKAVVNEDGTVSIPNQLLRNLVSRGLNTIEELTDAVHAQVVKDLPDVTKRQVRDYITDYGKTISPTADDIQKQVNEAKRTGRLLSELEDLQNKKRKEKKPSTRFKLSERERQLKRQIKSLDKSLPLSDSEKGTKEKGNLEKAKERVKNRIKELEEKIKNKDFVKKKKVEPEKDEELLELEKQKEKIQEQFDTEQYKAELKQRTFWQKVEDVALELTSGLVRGLVASVDLSAGFVQGLWRLFSNPQNSMNAFGTMFKHLVSEKGSQEYMAKLKARPEYKLMKASKLAIDDKDGKQSAKEGLFISNWINHIWNFMAKVVSLNYSPVKTFIKKINPYEASKRAFDGYVNSIRVQSFTQLAKQLSDKGYNYEADPEVFQKAADFVNTTTGRASLGAIENSSKWLNILMFAPRKVVSEVKLFTPYAFRYYAKMPAPVRKRALLNFSKFLIGFFGVNSLLWAALKDDDDEDDNFWNPTSSDFLTHKIGNKRVSIGGGMKSVITFMSRFATGEFTDQYGKTTKLGERFGKQINTRWDLTTQFMLGKASPAISAAAKKMQEKKGLEVDDAEMIKDLTVPMWMQDLKELYKDSPVEVGAMLSILGFFGANIRVAESKPMAFTSADKKDETFKYFTDRGAELPETKPGNIEIADESEGKMKKLKDYPEEKQVEFNEYRKEALKSELSNLQETGYVYVDKYGRVSLTESDDREEKSLDDLTEEEWKKVMSILGGKATKRAKEETFKTDSDAF